MSATRYLSVGDVDSISEEEVLDQKELLQKPPPKQKQPKKAILYYVLGFVVCYWVQQVMAKVYFESSRIKIDFL